MILDVETVKAVIEQRNSKRTRKQYNRIFNNYIKYIGNELNQQGINDFFNNIFDDRNEPYAKSRINVSFFNLLIKEYNLIQLKTPALDVKHKHNVTKLSYDDVKNIVYNIPIELAIYVLTYLETGLRLNELINIHRDNIDVENLTLAGDGKRGKPFLVDISKKVMDLLIKSEWLNKEFPFKQYDVKDTSKWVHYRFKHHTKALRYKNTSIHQIRHALGHYLREKKGYDLELIREILRHSSVVTTQIYSRATKQEARNAMKELLE